MKEALSLGSSITIRNIDALSASIIGAFEQHRIVELDASGVSEVDLSFLQLVECARNYAAQENKTIRLTAPANSSLLALLERAGALSQPTTEDIDFWCHGELPQ